jgi:hypothetical protein
MTMVAMVFSQNVQAALGAESEEYSCLMNALNPFDSQLPAAGEGSDDGSSLWMRGTPPNTTAAISIAGAAWCGRWAGMATTTDPIREKRPVMMRTSALTPKCSAKAMM